MRVGGPVPPKIHRVHARRKEQIGRTVTEDLIRDTIVADACEPGLGHLHHSSVSDLQVIRPALPAKATTAPITANRSLDPSSRIGQYSPRNELGGAGGDSRCNGQPRSWTHHSVLVRHARNGGGVPLRWRSARCAALGNRRVHARHSTSAGTTTREKPGSP